MAKKITEQIALDGYPMMQFSGPSKADIQAQKDKLLAHMVQCPVVFVPPLPLPHITSKVVVPATPVDNYVVFTISPGGHGALGPPMEFFAGTMREACLRAAFQLVEACAPDLTDPQAVQAYRELIQKWGFWGRYSLEVDLLELFDERVRLATEPGPRPPLRQVK